MISPLLWCDHPTATYILHMYSNIMLFMYTFSLNMQTRIHNILSLADTLSTLPYKELVIYASMPRLTICIQFPFILSESQQFLEIKLCTIPPKALTVNGHCGNLQYSCLELASFCNSHYWCSSLVVAATRLLWQVILNCQTVATHKLNWQEVGFMYSNKTIHKDIIDIHRVSGP